MHPIRAFAWTDEAAMHAFVTETAFAHIFAATPDGPMVAHAPVILSDDGRPQFHLARANRLTRHLDGAAVLISIVGANSYQSADWYEATDRVPTWLYRAVEIEGVAHALDEAGLIAQADALSATMEARLHPKPPWTRAKMPPGKFERMLPAIQAFAVRVTAMRGTLKLNQNSNAKDIAAMVAGQRSAGRDDIAALVEQAVAAR